MKSSAVALGLFLAALLVIGCAVPRVDAQAPAPALKPLFDKIDPYIDSLQTSLGKNSVFSFLPINAATMKQSIHTSMQNALLPIVNSLAGGLNKLADGITALFAGYLGGSTPATILNFASSLRGLGVYYQKQFGTPAAS